MDHDGNVVGIVEGRRGAIERGVIEVPLRRSEAPDELREILSVFVVADQAAFRGEIELVYPDSLNSRKKRLPFAGGRIRMAE
jgi:hypothetical protein